MSLSEKALDLCSMSRSELESIFETASPVALEQIEGYRYRGVSLGLPGWVETLSWKKFAKAFERRSDGLVHGWNLRIEQDDLSLPWRPRMKRGQEWRFGPFGMRLVPGSDHVEIDYGLGTKGLSPLRRVRDPLRSLDDEGNLLLGCSQVDLGIGKRLGTPSWFVLERDQPL